MIRSNMNDVIHKVFWFVNMWVCFGASPVDKQEKLALSRRLNLTFDLQAVFYAVACPLEAMCFQMVSWCACVSFGLMTYGMMNVVHLSCVGGFQKKTRFAFSDPARRSYVVALLSSVGCCLNGFWVLLAWWRHQTGNAKGVWVRSLHQRRRCILSFAHHLQLQKRAHFWKKHQVFAWWIAHRGFMM